MGKTPQGEMSPVERAFREGKPIDEALKRAAEDAWERHRRAGQSVVVAAGDKVWQVHPGQS